MKEYLSALNDKLREGNATEHTFRPVLEGLLHRLSKDSVVTNEPKRTKVGAPDFVIRRKIGKTQYLPIGYIETKDVGVDLNAVEKSEQIKRYLPLGNLLVTDYVTFRWYADGKFRAQAVLATQEKGKLKEVKDGELQVQELLQLFLSHQPLSISKPEELAQRMAALCKQIDRIIVEAFAAHEASELLRGLKDAFEKTLLPDLSESQFADMFTQTLAYGLFAARIRLFQEHPAAEFRRSEAAREIPKTNPFLRKLFETINGTEIEDEPFIGFVDDLTAIMFHADIAAILQYFGRRTGQEDPIVHFYETFLAAYDPKVRELRGVYYTPEPVVSYIVRSVDLLLKEKFGLKEGLADRSTIEVEVEEDGKKVKKMMPRVLILDPACGTGTFLYHVIKIIRERFMLANNAGEWSDFVRDHLLPRIYGFELLMAPYAVAHLKLAMQLAGQDLDEPLRSKYAYDFAGTERLNVYLTNSLELTEKKVQSVFWPIERQIAEEADSARSLKTKLPIMVVLGNPPYSGHSANKNDWIEERIREAYHVVDGQPLGERNPKWLQDDYVKFIRFGQWRIEQTGYGILAYISNHSYLDNPTFRGMRQSLLTSFDEIYLLDLHGSAKKKEVVPDGGKDENVFDIQQGVAIGLFVKRPKPGKERTVRKADLYGRRSGAGGKYERLGALDVKKTEWADIEPATPHYLFTERDVALAAEYEQGWKINEVMPVNSLGIATARDDLTIGMHADELEKRVEEFAALAEEEARERFQLGEDSRDWTVKLAQQDVHEHDAVKEMIDPILYRPFDRRFIYYTGETRGFICMPRTEVMQHMLLVPNNLGLSTTRSVEIGRGWEHVFCASSLIQLHTVSLKEVNYFFPLFIKEEDGSKSWDHKPRTLPNFTKEFVEVFYTRFPPSKRKMGKRVVEGEWVSERDIFNYIYAVFHSPTYRQRYAEFLKIDFPRVPITSDVESFHKLVTLGGELVKLHIMEFDLPEFAPPIPPASGGGQKISYPAKGDHKVERVEFVDKDLQVWINKTQYFEGVPPEVWEFHIGGYQVAEKWLKDRKGRILSAEDREHYRKTIYALSETIRLMAEIDAAIPEWPIT